MTVPSGSRVRAVSLHVSPELIEMWSEDESFAGSLSRLTARNGAFLLSAGTMNERTAALVRGVLGQDLSSVVDRPRAESAVLDLTSVTPGLLTSGGRGAPRSNERGAQDKARDILEAEWDAPSSIPALARRVGMNECCLKARFKARFGITIAGHVRDRRM